VLQAELGPRFQSAVVFLDFFDGSESGLEQVIFARVDFAGSELHDVDDPEMDTPDFGRVVVDKTDDSIRSAAFDLNFFGQFPVHASSIPIVSFGVFDGDMAADAERL
jgi:hypothetical protein